MTSYRPDIDGLRAIAVIVVVLFHARVGPFSGGFVGVDVFFVISGYLIAGIILDDIEAGKFSIAAFYERRMRRLFPALFAVLVACTIAGYLLFLPEEFRKFGQSVVATSVFVSNYLFWTQAGYFDTPAELKPLLHTWSLAVEEQFYLFFPAFLILVSKHAKRLLVRLVAIIAVVSFLISAASLVKHPDTAFYLPHTRIWELMIGALLVVSRMPATTTQRARDMFAGIGFVMILASAVLFSSQTPFPGPAALLPCLGAALIIHTGRTGGSIVHSALATRPFVYVGLISYSLYLWHWPILVFARAWAVRPLTTLEAGGLIVLSFVMADLSWRFVESPFRGRKGHFTRRQIFAFGGGATFAMIALGAVIDIRDGIPSRVPDAVAAAAAGASDVDETFKRRCSNFSPQQVSTDILCRIGANNDTPPTFLLWGDSHAYAIASMVSAAAHDANVVGLFAGSGGCAPLLGVSRTTRRTFACEAFNDAVLGLIQRDDALSTIVLASRWTLVADGRPYLNEGGDDLFVRDADSNVVGLEENRAVFSRGLERTLAALHDAGKHVVVVGPIPEIGFDVPATLARNLWFVRGFEFAPSRAAFAQRQQFVMETLQDLQRRFAFVLVRPDEILCDDVRCRIVAGEHPLYSDNNHLSITGAAALRPMFERVFRSMADAASPPAEVR